MNGMRRDRIEWGGSEYYRSCINPTVKGHSKNKRTEREDVDCSRHSSPLTGHGALGQLLHLSSIL